MNWTEDHKKFARLTLRRLGATRCSPATLAFLFKRHMQINPSNDEVSALLKALKVAPAQAAVKPLKRNTWRRGAKEHARQVINELKAEIEKAGVHTVPEERVERGMSPILMLSDLHFGEKVEVNGIEVFNIEIATKRFESIIQEVINAPELEAYHVDELVVILGGDIIDGELIFPGQAFETTSGVYDQMKIATKIIWTALTQLATKFPVIRVYCVPGNHGRTSKLHAQMSNWDNALYFGLQLISSFQTELNIEVHTPHQMWMDFNVRDWRVHARHIGVTQAQTAGPAKRVMTWMNNHNADLLFYGHYHCPELYSMGHKRIFKNGALPPMNEFAERLGFIDGGGQWLVGVTDDSNCAFAKILIPEG